MTLNLSGWDYIDLQGKAVGGGQLLGKDLNNLVVDIGYHTHKGPNVQIAADIADGNFEVAIKPKENSLMIIGNARSLHWWAADVVTTVDLHLEKNQHRLSGEVLTLFRGRQPNV